MVKPLSSDLLFEYIDAYDYSAAEDLILLGVDVNSRSQYDYTPLHLAVEKRYAEMAELLLDNNAEVSAPGMNWALTPLHIVSDFSCAMVLANHQADFFVKNFEGNPPLHHLAWGGKVEAVVSLLALGADMHALNAANLPAPYLAIQAPENGLAVLAVFKLAGYNFADNNMNYTLLHHCVAHLKPEIISWLLANGVDRNTKDDQGLTPLDYINKMVNSPPDHNYNPQAMAAIRKILSQ